MELPFPRLFFFHFFLMQLCCTGWIKNISFIFLLIGPCFSWPAVSPVTVWDWLCSTHLLTTLCETCRSDQKNSSRYLLEGLEMGSPLPAVPGTKHSSFSPCPQWLLSGSFFSLASSESQLSFSSASTGGRVLEWIRLEGTLKIIWIQHFGHRTEVILQLLLEIILESINICRLIGGVRLRASSS